MSDFEKMLFSNELRVKLTNIAMSKTFNEFDSDDLVQQTYLKALEKQDQFKGGLIDKWVVTILKNLHIDNTRKGTFLVDDVSTDNKGKRILEQRRIKRLKTYGDNVPDYPILDNSEEVLLERDKEICLEKLSEIEREVISLKQTDSYAEIANLLDLKQGTIRQIIFRAKEKFMICMEFINDWKWQDIT